MLFAVIMAVVAFCIFLTAHVIIFHKWPPKRRFRTLIGIALTSLILTGVISYILVRAGLYEVINAFIPEWIVGAAGGVFLYFFIYFLYFHQIIVFDRSVTPRMMVEFDSAPEKRLTIDELKSRYSLEAKLKRELDDMNYMKRITKNGEYYMNTRKGITHAKIMDRLREYLHVGGHQ